MCFLPDRFGNALTGILLLQVRERDWRWQRRAGGWRGSPWRAFSTGEPRCLQLHVWALRRRSRCWGRGRGREGGGKGDPKSGQFQLYVWDHCRAGRRGRRRGRVRQNEREPGRLQLNVWTHRRVRASERRDLLQQSGFTGRVVAHWRDGQLRQLRGAAHPSHPAKGPNGPWTSWAGAGDRAGRGWRRGWAGDGDGKGWSQLCKSATDHYSRKQVRKYLEPAGTMEHP